MGLKGNFPVHKEIAPELQENRQRKYHEKEKTDFRGKREYKLYLTPRTQQVSVGAGSHLTSSRGAHTHTRSEDHTPGRTQQSAWPMKKTRWEGFNAVVPTRERAGR